jgi:alpha-ketoglutaric semialdehyde dehydrogenase
MTQPMSCLNYIDGQWQPASSGGQIESRNPAQWREVVATAPSSAKTDVELAINAARKAYQTWKLLVS